MSLLIIGFCSGLIPALVISLVISNKCSRVQIIMRDRLAAEEASKRHFMQQASQLELTVERMDQEQKRLEVELARREGAAESMAA